MWENDKFRVWDQVIAPGETVGPHVHDNDYFIVTIESAEIDTEVLSPPSKHSEYEVIHENVIWVRSNGEEHTATNVDKAGKPWRNLIIEVKP